MRNRTIFFFFPVSLVSSTRLVCNKHSLGLLIESKNNTHFKTILGRRFLRPDAYSICMITFWCNERKPKEQVYPVPGPKEEMLSGHRKWLRKQVSITRGGKSTKRPNSYRSPERPLWTSPAGRSSCWPQWCGTSYQSQSECTFRIGCCCHCEWFWRFRWPARNTQEVCKARKASLISRWYVCGSSSMSSLPSSLQNLPCCWDDNEQS